MGTASQFVEHGMAIVEDALDPAFCEDVIARRLAEIGVDEGDQRSWPAGWRNLPATTVHPVAEVAPAAAEVLRPLTTVEGRERARRFLLAADNRFTLEALPGLRQYEGPALVAWGAPVKPALVQVIRSGSAEVRPRAKFPVIPQHAITFPR